jgi:DNA ligase-1
MFPTLYGKSKNGKLLSWEILVVSKEQVSLIITRHGFVDNKIIETTKEISFGKNRGKKNETTHQQQALKEAQSEWNKKVKAGYSESPKVHVDAETKVQPMLANKYETFKNKIEFPCFVQPKIDGVRCIYYNNTFYTRHNSVINNFSNISQELNDSDTKLILDGELYGENMPMQQLSGLINKKNLNSTDILRINNNVKYIVFDCIMPETTFDARYEVLELLFKKHSFSKIKLLKTDMAQSHTEIEQKYNSFLKEEYEGIMIRNSNSVYENYRSFNLLKYKPVEDAEFKIVGFTQQTGVRSGCVLWKCETPDGKDTFEVTQNGTVAEQRALYKNGANYIGKLLTVEYQKPIGEQVGVYQKPRHPKGKVIRDYE